ncbi:MAG TPA: ABC transporter permease [Solirubrobacterales bacterium]|jgi:NitT/TauT family transport system permease protein/putative hydroxymethylpyrimidine transport system permease protein
MKRWLLPTIALAGLIGLWQVAASSGALANLLNVDDFLAPSPAEIASSIWENRTLLAENAWVTIKEIVLGFACGVAAGLAFAVALRLSDTLRRALYPLIVASQAIPIIVFSPILLVWFGFGIGPKLVVVALICFFPIAVNTFDGLRSVDPEATKMMRTLDASRWQILWRVEAPSALPQAFTGARIAATFAPIAAIFGEWVGANTELGGLGVVIRQDSALLETARMFAAAAILTAIALILYGLVTLAERRIVTWR